jgi:hypothetical protein
MKLAIATLAVLAALLLGAAASRPEAARYQIAVAYAPERSRLIVVRLDTASGQIETYQTAPNKIAER